jgi:DNA polymerase
MELAACRPWLDAELELLKPRIVVPLGATAAQSLLGKSFRVTKQRGEPIAAEPIAEWIVATVHPSSIIRAPADRRQAEREAFRRDLAVVAGML